MESTTERIKERYKMVMLQTYNYLEQAVEYLDTTKGEYLDDETMETLNKVRSKIYQAMDKIQFLYVERKMRCYKNMQVRMDNDDEI